MKRICNICNTEMIDDCKIKIDGTIGNIIIKKKNGNLFNSISAIPKAAVCPNCGNVVFYINEYKKFAK